MLGSLDLLLGSVVAVHLAALLVAVEWSFLSLRTTLWPSLMPVVEESWIVPLETIYHHRCLQSATGRLASGHDLPKNGPQIRQLSV